MKIILAIKSGTIRSLRSWKGGLIMWFILIILVSLVALPMKGALKSGFGSSMITERITEHIDIEVFSDPGAAFSGISSILRRGIFILILAGLTLNAFLSGGLFNSVRGSFGKFSASDFWKASSEKFWNNMIVSLVMSLIVIMLVLVVIVIPFSFVSMRDGDTEVLLFRTGVISAIVFFLLLVVMVLVTDYARAKLVTDDETGSFKAIGFGFRQTFRTFGSSFPMMLALLVIQILYGWAVLKIISGITPSTGGGIIMLFLISQLLFFIKILFRIMRFGSVTSLMESTSIREPAPEIIQITQSFHIESHQNITEINQEEIVI